jgi:solute carrier family 13 (sodium-dependent dicarboxylate transporter), member 2/3/5
VLALANAQTDACEGASYSPRKRAIFTALGPTCAALCFFAMHTQTQPVRLTAALTVWVAVWWLTECVDAAITALLPLALLPILGVLTPVEVAQSYGNELILLLAGGFMLSGALESSGAHRRLALAMLRLCGATSGAHLIWGFAFATGLLSMWISNTATTLMMLPVAMAILAHYPDRRLRTPLILAIAYSASLGGMGTPMGTPPNLVFMAAYQQTTGTRFGFLEWLKIGLPLVAITLPMLAWWLSRGLRDSPAATLPAPGPVQSVEVRVLTIFGLIALAWIFRAEPFGGWSKLLGVPGANDAAVALMGVIVLCLIPDGRCDGQNGRCLDWARAEKIPWGALMVFAGGIALAKGFERSGLSDVLAANLGALTALPLPVMLLGLCLGVTLMSEIASNTATAVLLMPVLAAVAKSQGLNPALLMLPAALAASLGFMLPVATAPNAIAYGTGMVSNRQMLRAGWFVDLFGVLVLALVSWVAFGK